MRYEQGLTNEAIASRLNIGTKQVKARLEDSVKWLLAQQQQLDRMHHSATPQEGLERRLVKKFPHLKSLKVVPGAKIETEKEYDQLIRNWAFEAAAYFDEVVDSGEFREKGALHVAMSGGEAHLEVMNALRDRGRHGVHFYASAFIGRGPLNSFHVDPATNATIAWVRSGRFPGHCIYATLSPFDIDFGWNVPLSMRKKELARQFDELAKNESIKTITEQLDKVTVAFAGLGMVIRAPGSLRLREPTASELVEEAGVSARELASEGAVADLSYSFFDANGDGREDWRFFMTAGQYSRYPGLEFYRQRVREGKPVIVCAGPFKLPAILAALKGKLFNVWFTDEDTARKVLAKK